MNRRHVPALTAFRGRAGDHNDRAMSGSALLATGLAQRLGVPAHQVGRPEPARNADWEAELSAASPALAEMADRYRHVLDSGAVPVTAMSRCAVALATLPLIAQHRPDACVVWLDAHADLNTPENSETGYLGGMALSGPVGLWDSGLGAGVVPENVVLGGVRDIDPPEQRLIDAGTIAAVRPGRDLTRRLRETIAGRPVHVHLDCDVLEPGIVPTDYRVPGGIDLAELREVSAMAAEHEVVGIEIAEFEGPPSFADPKASGSPENDSTENDSAENDRARTFASAKSSLPDLLDALQPLLNAALHQRRSENRAVLAKFFERSDGNQGSGTETVDELRTSRAQRDQALGDR